MMNEVRMKLEYGNRSFKREVTELASAFFKSFLLEESPLGDSSEGRGFQLSIEIDGDEREINVRRRTVTLSKMELEAAGGAVEKLVKAAVYRLFSELSGKDLPWGTMTGIRPVKLYRKLMEEDPESAEARLEREYFLRHDKVEMLGLVYQAEERILTPGSRDQLQIYAGIPFCPSRCSYCSFASVKAKQDRSDIKEYLNGLFREIREVGETVGRNRKAQSIYIGGGTPGILTKDEISELIELLKTYFPDYQELTFEGGRPDVLDREKLAAAVTAGATRISINPQTMDDEILGRLGRTHDSKAVVQRFHEARECGCNDINMDLILGLPGDTMDGFLRSLDKVASLEPDSITVHALALKRSSHFHQNGLEEVRMDAEVGSKTWERLLRKGYSPYYLYRQKNTFMNLENVGYAKNTKDCIFNMQSMSDIQSCFAFGADGVSKFVTESGIERIHNPKFPKDYLYELRSVIEKKLTILHEGRY